jgi:TetR/AcrR family transcriptional repressor of lmrAB and yxaGH operons
MTGPVKRRMIEQAALSLARKGLQRTSFSEVLEASGAPRGSLYHHFPGGKDELVLLALEAAGGFALAILDQTAGQPAVEVARSFVTVAAESADLLDSAARIFRDWRVRLATLLSEGGAPADRASSLAATLIAACEGAVLLARAERNFEAFDQVAHEQIAAVAAATTAGAALPGTAGVSPARARETRAVPGRD